MVVTDTSDVIFHSNQLYFDFISFRENHDDQIIAYNTLNKIFLVDKGYGLKR